MRRLIVTIVFASLLRAGDDSKPRPKLPAAMQRVVDIARTTAPEIYANAIVALVESGKIAQRELQVELLEDAFHAAGRAVEPVRLIAIRGTPSDTREMYRSKAGELGMDAISLQSRILRNLVTVDRAKSRELFAQVSHPSLDPRPCEDALVADATAYYQVAAVIAQSFTAVEKENDAHLHFLMGLLSGAKSPGEVAAFAGAIENVSLTKAQLEILLAVIARKLGTVGADYRSFAVSFNAMEGGVARLAEFGRASGVDVEGLLGGFRKYLIAQLKAPRCKPDVPVAIAEMEWFRPGLSEEDMSPSERKGDVKTAAYFDSGNSKEVGEHLKVVTSQLMMKRARQKLDEMVPGNVPAGGSNTTGSGDPRDLSDFLREFALWTPAGSDVDVLHQRATVLAALLQLLPPGGERDKATGLSVELLATSGAQRQSPAEWMAQVKALSGAAGLEATEVFRRSGNPALLTYFAASLASSGTSK